MSCTKLYGDNLPKVGDIIELFDEAFGTAIVSTIDLTTKLVTVNRPHCRVSPGGSLSILIENVSIDLSRFRDISYFVTGLQLNVDNRRDSY